MHGCTGSRKTEFNRTLEKKKRQVNNSLPKEQHPVMDIGGRSKIG
jgi:hypothetical protein